MNIKSFVLGNFQTNSYVLTADADAKTCLIIDTGLQSSELVNYLKDNELIPEAVILTHGHADHIAGVAELRREYPDIKVAIHKNDAEMLTNPAMNLSALAGTAFSTEPADIIIDDQNTISFAGIEFEIFRTPGHTPGGISLYNAADGVVFSGDTLFEGSIGRSDFPGGSQNQLITSIKQKLLTLPDKTKVYSGHGYLTTIEVEKRSNPFLT